MIALLLAAASFLDVKRDYKPSDVEVLDRNGETIGEVRVDFSARRLAWTSLDDIAPSLVQSVLQTEDRRFYGHPGVDLWALPGALRPLLSGLAPRGASTLTMQLAGLLHPDRKKRASLLWKAEQVADALSLERHWTKPEILEAYLNLVPFHGELIGIRAASRVLYGKQPHGLTPAESTQLARMIARPQGSAQGGPGGNARSFAKPLRGGSGTESQNIAALAPHFARRALPTGPHTTLDASLQRVAVHEIESQLSALTGRNVHDAAALVLDNKTGAILAYVGSNPSTSQAPEVDGVQARRQAGSTLKPFLYALAFEQRLLSPDTLLDDSPVEIPVEGGLYRPRNYDERFHGLVPVRVALASSLNVPAVKTLQLVGVDLFLARLKSLGFSIPHEGDYFGPSLALGSVDVTLDELVHAYRTLATDPVISEILADRSARALTFGLENHLSLPFSVAAKTGTSKDMRDNWCIGFTPDHTVGVWVGNFNGSPMWNVSGVSGAAPIWSHIMRHLGGPKVPTTPAAHDTPALATAVPRLSYPISGMIIAFDPDIPKNLQELVPEITPPRKDVRMTLDGRTVKVGAPLPIGDLGDGAHELTLAAEDGAVLDRVSFSVGGSPQDASEEP